MLSVTYQGEHNLFEAQLEAKVILLPSFFNFKIEVLPALAMTIDFEMLNKASSFFKYLYWSTFITR